MHLFLVYFFCYWNHHHLSGFHFISAYDSHSCTIHNNHTAHITQLNFLCLVKWVQPFRCSRGFFLPPSEFHIRTFFANPVQFIHLQQLDIFLRFRSFKSKLFFFISPNQMHVVFFIVFHWDFSSSLLQFIQYVAYILTVCCCFFSGLVCLCSFYWIIAIDAEK